MVILIMHVIKAEVTSVVQPMGEGFYLSIIPDAQNCLEDMVKNFNGDIWNSETVLKFK